MDTTGIYFLIIREVIILISIAALISLPVTYYIAANWLETFSYRITPGILSFISGLIIVILIALLTISYKVLKAAGVNPSKSLKYD